MKLKNTIQTMAMAALLLGSSLGLQAQQKINEGSITYTYTNGNEATKPESYRVLFKDSIVKMSTFFGVAGTEVLMDMAAQNKYILVPQSNSAFRLNKDETLLGGMPELGMGFAKIKSIKATGEQKTINGFLAEKYTGKSDEKDCEFWVSKTLELPFGKLGTLVQGPAAMAFQTLELKGLVLQFKGSVSQKELAFSVQVKAENVGTLQFALPEGYTEYSAEELDELLNQVMGRG